MRAVLRPLAFVIFFFCAIADAGAQALPVPKGEGVNDLAFQAGSPTPRLGGVDVAVTQRATTGFLCTQVTIRVIDDLTGATLATHIVNNPGGNVAHSFIGLGNNRKVQIVATAKFAKGEVIDTKSVQALVTTQ